MALVGVDQEGETTECASAIRWIYTLKVRDQALLTLAKDKVKHQVDLMVCKIQRLHPLVMKNLEEHLSSFHNALFFEWIYVHPKIIIVRAEFIFSLEPALCSLIKHFLLSAKSLPYTFLFLCA